MALPAEVNSAEASFRGAGIDGAGESGPVTVDGAVFGLFHDRGNHTIEVWWDEAPTRGEGFAEADSANHPGGFTTGADDSKRPAWCISGNHAYVAYKDASGNVALDVFSLVLKTWVRSITSSIALVRPTVGSQGTAITLQPVPGEVIRVIFNGTQIASDDVVYYVDIDMAAGTFGTPVTLLNSTGVDYEIRSSLLGIGGLTHAFAQKHTGSSGLIHISIAPDGTIGTEQTVTTDFRPEYGWCLGDSYYDVAGGATKLAIPYVKALDTSPNRYGFGIATADSAADPSWTTATLCDDPALDDSLGVGLIPCCCAWFADSLYAYFAGTPVADIPQAASFQDLWRAVDTGSGFGAATLVHSDGSVSVSGPAARAIDIGIGLFFTISGKPYYNQYEIDPCGSAPVVNLIGAAY